MKRAALAIAGMSALASVLANLFVVSSALGLQGKEQPSSADAKPDFSLTSEVYAAEYKKDKKAHEARYTGKSVELKGVVKMVGRGLGEHDFLVLQGEKNDVIGVQCVTQ